MGSWNESCAISNLPIFADDEVYLLVLAENPWNDKNRCYPETFFAPYAYPFKGVYNDYGSIETSTTADASARKTVQLVKQNLLEFDKGKNPYHDIEVKQNNFDLDMLMEANHVKRLFLKNKYNGLDNAMPRHRQAFVVMIRKEVFEGIVTDYNPKVYTEVENVDDKPIYGYISFDELLHKEFTEFLYQSLEATTGPFAETPQSMRTNITGISTGEGELIADLRRSTKSPEDFAETKDKIIQLIKLNAFMSETRRMWVPPSGSGGQHAEMYAYEMLAKITNNSIKQIKKQFND